jgi:hypothetical protein|tara:strand:+ start:4179 stop:4661 length:483 start_codon:yes stop_codon:yes gene_type:complete
MMTKNERNIKRFEHIKQKRQYVGNGVPLVTELEDGVPVLRSTSEGVVQYIRYNGVLYKNVMKNALDSLDVSRFADDGYIKFDNGLIMQWGQETSSATTEVVVFPIPFSNSCLNVVATAYESGSASGNDGAVTVSVLPTTTGVTFGSDTGWGTIFWQAIGY